MPDNVLLGKLLYILTKYRKIINRSIDTTDETYGLGRWNPDGGLMSRFLYFSWYNRVYNYTPTLTCSRDIDKFTVSNSIGNGKLTYPVGLLTNVCRRKVWFF